MTGLSGLPSPGRASRADCEPEEEKMKSELTFTEEELCIIRDGLRRDFDERTERLFKKVSAEIKWLQEAERRGAEFQAILNASRRKR